MVIISLHFKGSNARLIACSLLCTEDPVKMTSVVLFGECEAQFLALHIYFMNHWRLKTQVILMATKLRFSRENIRDP